MKTCKDCDICCSYITVEIGEPKNKKDFDELRWILLHEGITLFVDEKKEWRLQIDTYCRNLKDKRCADYKNRPSLCKKYSINNCDRFGKI